MIAEGYYKAKPTGGKLTTSGSKNTPTFAVNFQLSDELTKTVFLYASDAAWPHTEEKLKALGWDGNPDEMRFTTEEIELACKHEEYQGKTREKWDVAWGQREYEAAPADVRRNVMARWKAAGNKPAPKPSAAPVATAHKPINADDIPF